jgi:hypothetical protein
MAVIVLASSRTPNGQRFQESIAQYLREAAERDRQAGAASLGAKQHQRLLEQLAEYVLVLDARTDQHIHALWRGQALRGDGSGSKGFNPGLKTRRLIANAGRDLGTQPTTAELLDELVALGVEDLYDTLTAKQALSSQRTLDEERQKIIARAEAEVMRAQDSEAKWRGELDTAKGELAEARKVIEDLRARLPEEKPEKPETRKPKAKAAA